ncbi:hypothetical protein H4Q26_001603 [Puccinia striiformis f. sp. tritici PST-130]|nr:hypothetical protein H4Q26_001603 [Puccinia striiformis f. sp. tritici PST-130]
MAAILSDSHRRPRRPLDPHWRQHTPLEGLNQPFAPHDWYLWALRASSYTPIVRCGHTRDLEMALRERYKHRYTPLASQGPLIQNDQDRPIGKGHPDQCGTILGHDPACLGDPAILEQTLDQTIVPSMRFSLEYSQQVTTTRPVDSSRLVESSDIVIRWATSPELDIIYAVWEEGLTIIDGAFADLFVIACSDNPFSFAVAMVAKSFVLVFRLSRLFFQEIIKRWNDKPGGTILYGDVFSTTRLITKRG